MEKATPYVVLVQPGKKYFWCRCGLTRNQPFCDGSHRTTDVEPVEFTSPRQKYVYFCGCRRSADMPLCDGTHRFPDKEQES